MSRPAIVFVGFMGAGKSRALSTLGGAVTPTIDADRLIEERVGMDVRQYFDTRGERAFREIESEVVGDALAAADGGAIALGGGAVLDDRIRAELVRHTVVWLDVDATSAWERVSGSRRPLVQKGREEFDALFAQRRPLYEELADAILPASDPRTVANALDAIKALAELPDGTKLLWAATASGEYPVLVGRGLLGSDWWPLEGRRFCIADTTTFNLYSGRIGPLADSAAVLEPGERTKNLAQVGVALEALAEGGMTREDHVVALGGGVVGDLAGFCAHVYQRGVPVVQVPTTLVAQVDSAIGGKTGVDLPQGKNYAGAYHQPAAVLADVGTLESLPREELAAGFVEVLKTGLLAGGPLWERVRLVEDLNPYELSELVFACARFKCDVVAADERDGGLRHMLNLGHTVGHAIEAATAYERYRHGEAVGIGLLAALRLSGAAELREEAREILVRHDLPVELDRGEDPAAFVEAILGALQRDKKRTAAGVGFVLLAEPGRPEVGQLVPDDEVRAAVEELLP